MLDLDLDDFLDLNFLASSRPPSGASALLLFVFFSLPSFCPAVPSLFLSLSFAIPLGTPPVLLQSTAELRPTPHPGKRFHTLHGAESDGPVPQLALALAYDVGGGAKKPPDIGGGPSNQPVPVPVFRVCVCVGGNRPRPGTRTSRYSAR